MTAHPALKAFVVRKTLEFRGCAQNKGEETDLEDLEGGRRSKRVH
jgi:hypothetical protein